MTSVSIQQELLPWWTELVSFGSKMDQPLTKAEPISNVGSASVLTSLRKSETYYTAAWREE